MLELHQAILNGYPGQVEAVLIKGDADIEARYENKYTAIQLAWELAKRQDRAREKENYMQIAYMLEQFQKYQSLSLKAKIIETDPDPIKLSKLFDVYASAQFILGRDHNHKKLALIISQHLKKNSDWSFEECQHYLEEKIKNYDQWVEPFGTFNAILIYSCGIRAVSQNKENLVAVPKVELHSAHYSQYAR